MIAVNESTNQFSTTLSDPLPSGWSFVTTEAFNALRIQGFNPTELLRQDTLTVLNRLTDAESQALHNAQQSDYRVSKFVLMAGAAGVIDQADPNYNAAVTLLDSLQVIAAARWPTLLAP